MLNFKGDVDSVLKFISSYCNICLFAKDVLLFLRETVFAESKALSEIRLAKGPSISEGSTNN